MIGNKLSNLRYSEEELENSINASNPWSQDELVNQDIYSLQNFSEK